MTGRVYDIDAVFVKLLIHALPKTCGRSRCDCDTAFLFLLHPIHHCRTVVHLAHLVRDTGIEQDSLGSGRLAGIYMRHDADITIML